MIQTIKYFSALLICGICSVIMLHSALYVVKETREGLVVVAAVMLVAALMLYEVVVPSLGLMLFYYLKVWLLILSLVVPWLRHRIEKRGISIELTPRELMLSCGYFLGHALAAGGTLYLLFSEVPRVGV